MLLQYRRALGYLLSGICRTLWQNVMCPCRCVCEAIVVCLEVAIGGAVLYEVGQGFP
jgi:hypothetical protein